jgi:hypothetical protein
MASVNTNTGQKTNPGTSAQPQTSSMSGTSPSDPLEKVSLMEEWIIKLPERLGEHNWRMWKVQMMRLLRLCGVEEYVDGTLQRPSDAAQEKIWDYNDNYARHVIFTNIPDSEMVWVIGCKTAHAVWQGLEDIHDPMAHFDSAFS